MEMPMNETERRFDRLETKIDKLTDAVTKIVRVEQKLEHMTERMTAIEERTDKCYKDINNVAEMARSNSVVARFADKVFWLVVAGGVSTAWWMLR